MDKSFSETPPSSPGLYWERSGSNDKIIYLPADESYPAHWEIAREQALAAAPRYTQRQLLRKPVVEWKVEYSGPIAIDDRWSIIAKGELPPTIEREFEFDRETSVEVLTLDKWGKMRIAVMDRWDSDDPFKWHTTCRDHLDIDGTIVAWMLLPSL